MLVIIIAIVWLEIVVLGENPGGFHQRHRLLNNRFVPLRVTHRREVF